VLHVDLDQFIAAVEVQRHPELRGRPVVVGTVADPTQRGVVSTASYEARAFGVRSGMPLRVALKRCPDAVFLAADKPAYEAVSATVMAALRELGPIVEVLGWDEAFLAAPPGSPLSEQAPELLADAVRRHVLERTGLHCSVGIGDNPLQAKIATEFGKPAGVHRLTSASWFDELGDRTPDVLWGVGRATTRKLADLGVTTVRELARADPQRLAASFGPTIGPWLVRLGQGIDRSRVTAEPAPVRSRSRETTFPQDVADAQALGAEIVRLARQVADDVAAEGRDVVRVVVKVRSASFTTRTHGVALAAPTRAPEPLEGAALQAWHDLRTGREDRPVRLLGVRAEFA
jgi:DNA polymerase-4